MKEAAGLWTQHLNPKHAHFLELITIIEADANVRCSRTCCSFMHFGDTSEVARVVLKRCRDPAAPQFPQT